MKSEGTRILSSRFPGVHAADEKEVCVNNTMASSYTGFLFRFFFVAFLVTAVQGCRKNAQCSSGWCTGGSFFRSGKCEPKRQDGQPCRKNFMNSCYDASCAAGYTTCGICGKVNRGQRCSANRDCLSGPCLNPRFANIVAGCSGTCHSYPTPSTLSAECMEKLTDSIFDLDADGRQAAFETLYAYKFNRLAQVARESVRQMMIKAMSGKGVNAKAMKEEFLAFADRYVYEKLRRKLTKTGKKLTKKGAAKLLAYAANSYIEQEIIKSTTNPKYIGKSAAQMATRFGKINARLDAFAGARAAFTGVKVGTKTAVKAGTMTAKAAALMPTIGATLGEKLAKGISKKAGVTNHHAYNSIAVSGAVAGGAAAGFAVGGPVGAAVGGAAGVASWGIGALIDAGLNTGFGINGPNDNWAYMSTGKLGRGTNAGFLTFNKQDTFYAHSYWNRYASENTCVFVMSAGQRKTDPFQVSVRDNRDKQIVLLKKVHYRDFIHVGRNKSGRLMVAHAKGEYWYKDGGKVDLHYI